MACVPSTQRLRRKQTNLPTYQQTKPLGRVLRVIL